MEVSQVSWGFLGYKDVNDNNDDTNKLKVNILNKVSLEVLIFRFPGSVTRM